MEEFETETSLIVESLEVFDKSMRMVNSAQTECQLKVCRNYFNLYKERYSTVLQKDLDFERNFEKKRVEILKKKIYGNYE